MIQVKWRLPHLTVSPGPGTRLFSSKAFLRFFGFAISSGKQVGAWAKALREELALREVQVCFTGLLLSPAHTFVELLLSAAGRDDGSVGQSRVLNVFVNEAARRRRTWFGSR